MCVLVSKPDGNYGIININYAIIVEKLITSLRETLSPFPHNDIDDCIDNVGKSKFVTMQV